MSVPVVMWSVLCVLVVCAVEQLSALTGEWPALGSVKNINIVV